MEATEPVSMDETMEILDDQNYALESTSPDDGRLTQAKGVPSLALPVGSRAESAIVDSLSSSSFEEDWLKSVQINQGKLIGAASFARDVGASMDSALIGVAGLQRFQDHLKRAAVPVDLRAASFARDVGASMDSALIGAVGLQRLQDHLKSAAMSVDLGVASFVRDAAASVNTTLAWAEILQEHRKELFRIDERMMRHVEPLLESLKPITGLYLNDDERFATCCMRLGQRGWFLDPPMPMSLLWHLADTIEESPEEADELLMQWFRERLDEIEEELVKTCPRRACVLRSAFNAHRERDYNNSVPAFLKEADGVWHDLFGMNVFIAKDRKSIIKSIEQKQPYGLVWTSLGPLLQSTLPLWMNERERHNWMKKHRTDYFPGLNRHEVLHGISVDYGTETNSLKAISFLNWRLVVELVVREPL